MIFLTIVQTQWKEFHTVNGLFGLVLPITNFSLKLHDLTSNHKN